MNNNYFIYQKLFQSIDALSEPGIAYFNLVSLASLELLASCNRVLTEGKDIALPGIDVDISRTSIMAQMARCSGASKD